MFVCFLLSESIALFYYTVHIECTLPQIAILLCNCSFQCQTLTQDFIVRSVLLQCALATYTVRYDIKDISTVIHRMRSQWRPPPPIQSEVSYAIMQHTELPSATWEI